MQKLTLILTLFMALGCQKETVEVVTGPGNLEVTGLTRYEWLESRINSTYSKVLEIKNTGSLPVSFERFSTFDKSSPIQYSDALTPGEDGACSQDIPLEAGESCSIGLEFTPKTGGSWSASLELDYYNGIDKQGFKLPIEASAGLLANLMAPDHPGTLGIREIGQTVESLIRIENVGGLTARSLSGTLEGEGEVRFKGGSWPGSGGNCGTTLAAGASCFVAVTFSPTVNRSHEQSLILSYVTAGESRSSAVSVSATSAEIKAELFLIGLTPPLMDMTFDPLQVGRYGSKTLKIGNFGYAKATGINITVNPPFFIGTNNCGAELEVSTQCSLEVVFHPLTKGDFSQPLVVSFHDGKNTLSTQGTMKGSSTLPAIFALSTGPSTPITSFTYLKTAVKGTRRASFTLKNTGEYSGTINTISTTGNFTLIDQTCNLGQLRGPLSTCSITVDFTPLSAGNLTGTLVVNYHNGVSTITDTYGLSGEAENLPYLKLVGGTREFLYPDTLIGDESASQTVEIQNTGLGDAINMEFVVTQPFVVENNNCPSWPQFTLPSLSSCKVDVKFVPTVEGAAGAILSLKLDNAQPGASPMNLVNLGGKGTLPAVLQLSTDPLPLAFAVNQAHYFVVTVYNSGSTKATISNSTFSDPLALGYNGGSYPGNVIANDQTGCLTEIPAKYTCNVVLKFTPTLIKTYNENLTLEYFNGQSTVTSQISFSSPSQNLGFLRALSLETFAIGIEGGPAVSKTIRIYNDGTAPIINLSLLAPTGNFGFSGKTCGTTIAAGGTCDLTYNYNPLKAGTFGNDIIISYNDGAQDKTATLPIAITVKKPALLSIIQQGSLLEETDFGTKIRGTETFGNFAIRNTQNGDATSVVLPTLSAPFSYVSNDCGATIEGNSFCSFRIKFAPGLSDIDLERILNYSVSYNDGLVTKTINRTIKGKGENYLSNHGGWTDITAYGNKINSSNSTLAAIFVQLKWNAMVPTNGTITGYNVYRSLTTDFTTPLATIADPTVRTFTDSGVTGGQTYYYLVRPIVDGYPSRVIQNTATVKVIAPPKNMTLIHQFMANKEMCDLLGESSDLNNNYRCAYNGPGSKSGFFDLGYNLLVDRYETGSDGTARPGQLPKLATQNGANILCTNQKETINGAVTSKLLLNRLEWTSAANWPATLTGITELEASAGGLDCNGTSAGLEATGGNTNCMSRFGVENAAGNAWEWVSERTYDGVGISQASQKIDPTNTLLDGVDFSSFSTGIWDSNFQCYYPLLNLPAKIDPLTGGCVEGSISTASKNFHEDYYWSANSGTAFGLAGGAAYSNQYSGVFSFAWVAYTFNGGAARCGIRVP